MDAWKNKLINYQSILHDINPYLKNLYQTYNNFFYWSTDNFANSPNLARGNLKIVL